VAVATAMATTVVASLTWFITPLPVATAVALAAKTAVAHFRMLVDVVLLLN
jgi:hypothetical protein